MLQGLALTIGGDGHAGRPGDGRVGHHGRVGRIVPPPGDLIEAIHALGDDLERLVALVEAHGQTVVAVGSVVDGDVEVVGLVAAVRGDRAHVQWIAGGPEARPGQPHGHGGREADLPHPDESGFQDRVLHEEGLEFADVVLDVRHDRADEIGQALGDVLGQAAGTHVGVVHAQAGDHLEDPQNVLAAAEGDGHERRAAHLIAARSDGDGVGGDAVQLHEQHTHDRGLLGDVVGNAEELLDRQGVADLLEEGGDVVHAGHEGLALDPGAVLHVLLDARVQVAGAHADLGDPLAVDLQHQAQHAVGGGVDGAHVEHDAVVGETVGLVARGDGGDDVVPVPAAERVLGGAVGEVVGGGAGGAEVGCGCGAHQWYDLRVSAGAVEAPLYSTGIPPSG